MAKKLSTSSILFTVTPLVLVAVIGLAIYQGKKPSHLDDFAQCLTDKGAIMFGAWWCPHCENQKAEFGNAFENITYVECSPNQTRTMSAECRNEGIESFPTWRFTDGDEDWKGERSLSALGGRAGCELPEAES